MAKKKYYAVLGGQAPGIYDSWEECSRILQEKGGKCKGFSEKKDAQSYLDGTDVRSEAEKIHTLTAYVDGSFEASVGRYGFGCVMLLPDREPLEFYGSGCNESSAALRNVTGEMLGAMFAVKWAMAHGHPELTLCYDYEGIAKWATGAWKTNTELTKKYADSMKKWGTQIRIHYQKIAAHTGNRYNECADGLAKRAIREEAPIPDFRI